MKSTVAYLSSISRMKYNIEKNSLINKLSGLENTVRKKFNIKVNTKLKDIECYTSQCSFIFSNCEVIFLVDKFYK